MFYFGKTYYIEVILNQISLSLKFTVINTRLNI